MYFFSKQFINFQATTIHKVKRYWCHQYRQHYFELCPTVWFKKKMYIDKKKNLIATAFFMYKWILHSISVCLAAVGLQWHSFRVAIAWNFVHPSDVFWEVYFVTNTRNVATQSIEGHEVIENLPHSSRSFTSVNDDNNEEV